MHYVPAKPINLYQAVARTLAILILGITLFHFINTSEIYEHDVKAKREVQELHSFHERFIVCNPVNAREKKVMEIHQTKVRRMFTDGRIKEEIEQDTILLGLISMATPCPVDGSPTYTPHSPFPSLAFISDCKAWLGSHRRIFQE